MKRSLVLSCLASALLIAIIFESAIAAEASDEEKAVRLSAQAFVEAFNNSDAKAVASLWTTDGDYSLGADTAKGRDAIQKLYEEFFKMHPGSKMKVDVESVRLIAPTVALEQGTSTVSESQNGPPTASKYSAIHVKQPNGKWLMASVRESESRALIKQDLSELAWLVGSWNAGRESGKIDVSYEWIANKHFIRGETKVRKKDASQETVGGTQIIGRNPLNGQIVSWFFNADGGHGFGAWMKDGKRWVVESQGTTSDGEPSTALNILHRASDDVMSWQSINRTVGEHPLPDTKEVVIERNSPNARNGRAESSRSSQAK